MPTNHSTLGITYEVREDPHQRGRWMVMRSGAATGGFGKTIHMAVGSAIASAQHEVRTSGLKIKVVSVVGNKRTTEWVSE